MPPHQQYPPRGQGTPDGDRSCACFHLTNDQSVMSVDNPEINTVELGAAPQVGDPGTVAIPGEPRHSNNEKDPSSGDGSTAIVIPNAHTDPNVERLRHEHEQLLQTLHNYRRELSTANEQIDHLRRHDTQSRQLQSDTEKQFHSTNDLLKRQIAETVEENVLLKQDNTALRSVIANSKATLSAVHEESHYVGHLDGLNHLIQSSVAKAFKSNSNQNLSEEAGNKVLDILSEIDPHGRKTVETLSHTTIWTLHKTGRKRIGVVRHIIALFLWSSVFNPFAFGLEKSVSDNLRIVEDSLLSELDFAQVLKIRQALGQAEVRRLGKSQEIARTQLVTHLIETLQPLLPRPMDIHPMISKIVDMAVKLANDMTGEQALFRCQIVETGRTPSESDIQVADDKQSGNVFMCTFPFFARLIWDDGKERLVPVVKASVELESAYQ